MAYIPPHKRQSKDAEKPTLAPNSLNLQSLTLGSQRRRDRCSSSQQAGKIFYNTRFISRWWPVGSAAGEDDPIPASFHLEPVSNEDVERKNGLKPQVLSSGGDPLTGESICLEASPWVMIAERIEPVLRDSVVIVLKNMGSGTEEIKMSLVARIGKVHFAGNVCLDSIRNAATSEADSRNHLRKSFYTNVPSAYMEGIQHLVVPKVGLDFELEKEHYHVKVVDKRQPDSLISCKCALAGDGSKLEIHKIELNPVHCMVVDLSCFNKDLDLRLTLVTKKMKTLNDEEKDGIDKLIKSAILDPDVRGGLRWPLGKDSVAERFSIGGVWHTKYKSFRGPTMRLKLRNVDRYDNRDSSGQVSSEVNLKHTKYKSFRGPTMRLKLRHADRYDHRASSGQVSSEVTLKHTGISERDGDLETEPLKMIVQDLKMMVQDAVKLIWNHFLTINHPPA